MAIECMRCALLCSKRTFHVTRGSWLHCAVASTYPPRMGGPLSNSSCWNTAGNAPPHVCNAIVPESLGKPVVAAPYRTALTTFLGLYREPKLRTALRAFKRAHTTRTSASARPRCAAITKLAHVRNCQCPLTHSPALGTMRFWTHPTNERCAKSVCKQQHSVRRGL